MQLRKKKPEKSRISKLKTMGKQISIQTSLIYLNMVTTVCCERRRIKDLYITQNTNLNTSRMSILNPNIFSKNTKEVVSLE